jgi:hypothetical protein
MVQSLGAFAPRPPAYADRLIELIHRFAASPRAAADAARLADAQFAARLLGENDAAWAALDPRETGRLLRLLATFVGRQARMPDELINPLAASAPVHPSNDDDGKSENLNTASSLPAEVASSNPASQIETEASREETPPSRQVESNVAGQGQRDSEVVDDDSTGSERTLFGKS